VTIYSHREALELICALGSGERVGHRQAMMTRIARTALLGYRLELSESDWAMIESNWPKGKPLRKLVVEPKGKKEAA
jgi:hypothetical protein